MDKLDLNSEENSCVIKYLSNQQIEFRDDVEVDQTMKKMYKDCPLKLSLCYENYCEKGFPDFTNYTPGYKGTLDHILYSDGLATISLGKIPSKEDFKHISGIPNRDYPSDHLPLIAELAFID